MRGISRRRRGATCICREARPSVWTTPAASGVVTSLKDKAGPLSGIRVLEIGGIGPAPFAGMLLGDLGADVIRLDPPTQAGTPSHDPVLFRNRRSVTVDLKQPAGVELVAQLAAQADAAIEGFRPGVL